MKKPSEEEIENETLVIDEPNVELTPDQRIQKFTMAIQMAAQQYRCAISPRATVDENGRIESLFNRTVAL